MQFAFAVLCESFANFAVYDLTQRTSGGRKEPQRRPASTKLHQYLRLSAEGKA